MKGGDPDQNRRPSMFAESQDTEKKSCDQIGDLQTPRHFRAWEKQHSAALRQREIARQRTAQLTEAERFARAQDAVISDVKRWRREGMSLQEVANKLQNGYGRHCSYTYDDLLAVLRELCAADRRGNPSQRGDT